MASAFKQEFLLVATALQKKTIMALKTCTSKHAPVDGVLMTNVAGVSNERPTTNKKGQCFLAVCGKKGS